MGAESINIKKNYIYNVSYQLLVMIAPLITTPYISRALGADNIGMYSYVNSIVSYFTLFANLGITIYGQREISYVQDSRKNRSDIFWEIKILQICTSGLAAAAYLIFALLQDQMLFYLVFIFNILAVTADVTWFFQGIEDFKNIVVRNVVFKILNIIYIFCVVRNQKDLIPYSLGMGLFLFMSNASLWVSLSKYVGKPDVRMLRPFRNFKTILSLFIPTIAIEVYTVLDKTMIGLITRDAFENGYYEQAIKISRMALTMVTALGTVMVPRIGFYFHCKENEKIQSLIFRGYQFVWFLGVPLCLGLIGISPNFVPWFFGAGYGKVVPLLYILSFLIPAIGISNVTGIQYLIPTKRQNMLSFTVITGAATNLVMNLILIPRLQAVGAAIASVMAEAVISLVQLCLVRKEISLYKVFSCGVRNWIAGLVMLAVLMFENSFLPASFINTCIMIATGVLVYFLSLYVIRRRN